MATTDPRYRGLPFMAALVPLVLDGRKTVTRRTGRKPAEVGDLLWNREAWRTHSAIDHRPTDDLDTFWWVITDWSTTPPSERLIPVWYGADYGSEDPVGRPRQARFLPRDLARPWRGRVVSVERVPAPTEGIDDDEAIREGVTVRSLLGRTRPLYTLDGVGMWDLSPAAAFLAAWSRLHPDPSAVHAGGVPGHVWRVEWVTEVPRG